MNNDNVLVFGRKFRTGVPAPEMTCQQAREIAKDVIDGKKRTPSEAGKAAGHMITCPKCNLDLR